MPKQSSSSLRKLPFITDVQAIGFNRSLVTQTGEQHHLLDISRLKNAIMKPINIHNYEKTRDVCRLGSATIYGLSKSHAFEQGNKRTAFVCGLRFIEQCGFSYNGAKDGKELGFKIIELCENKANERDIEEFLRRFVFRVQLPQ